jgi:hypothetical protein
VRITRDRWAAFSAFASLALGAAGVAFERADPSVLAAGPTELAGWARRHHVALLAQSALFGTSATPMLVFFAGLQSYLASRGSAAAVGRVDLSLRVLAAGAVGVMLNLLGQVLQVRMAVLAARGGSAHDVASLAGLSRTVVTTGNAGVAVAAAATGLVSLRDDGGLPRWLGRLSAVTAGLHLLSLAGLRVRRGPLSRNGVLAYLPYPVFAGWLVGVAVTMLRRPRDVTGPGEEQTVTGRRAKAPQRTPLERWP